MPSMRSHIVCVGLMLAAAACGGNTLSDQEAVEAFTSVNTALAEVDSEVEAAGSGQVSVTATCTGGGSVSADGQWQSGESFSLDLGFDACSVANITINGDIGYTATGNATSATVTVDGQLDFSGRVNGSCGVDLTMVVTQFTLSANGSICGVDIHFNSP